MTSEPVVGAVFGRPAVGKTTLSYICLPFHSPTQASQLTRTSSYYQFRCYYPLITYLIFPLQYVLRSEKFWKQNMYDYYQDKDLHTSSTNIHLNLLHSI